MVCSTRRVQPKTEQAFWLDDDIDTGGCVETKTETSNAQHPNTPMLSRRATF